MPLRVLLTNDDGGPNDLASPYVKYLVEAIELHTDWQLTIAVPSSQKSWIGKAHFAGRDVQATYIYSTIDKPEDNSYHGPFAYPQPNLQADKKLKEWILLDGTPATCADIGVNHLAPGGKSNVDLVLSGPNVGRNTSALYTLSSGTVGGAMEGHHHGKRAVALSYSFDGSPQSTPDILREASLISVKLIAQLYKNWNPKTDIYSVNVPLNSDLKLGKTKILRVPLLENSWSKSLFETSNGSKAEIKVNDIVDQSITSGQVFKWRPDFDSVHKGVALSEGVNDGKAIAAGNITVTAMIAAFRQVNDENQGELILEE
ncbi:unnamed protein product [Ambrosiozyma monospora]|uniref:Unnamed protein product n=1 Tax=Ambrosiozyma monospora TaxID=43982 RepID=A0ACB5TC06_AMBMO|nr:unnamed protein product [Ambrosiozyma monospora]